MSYIQYVNIHIPTRHTAEGTHEHTQTNKIHKEKKKYEHTQTNKIKTEKRDT